MQLAASLHKNVALPLNQNNVLKHICSEVSFDRMMFSKCIYLSLLLSVVFVVVYGKGSGAKAESEDKEKKNAKDEKKTEELCAVATEICELTEKEKTALKEEATSNCIMKGWKVFRSS